MYQGHEAGKRRKLEASSDPGIETDEQLARRLHEELNALTRHSRRSGNNPPLGSSDAAQQRSAKGAATRDAKALRNVKHSVEAAAANIDQHSTADVKQPADGRQQQDSSRLDKQRKRSLLSRELAMLVTDMVDSHVKPATGPRLKVKDEHDQQDSQLQDLHSAAAKHDSSSSLSEQERLAIEHIHALGADLKAVVQQVATRASDSGNAAGDSCTTNATSSAKASSGNQDQEQQQTSRQHRLQRSGTVTSAAHESAARIGSTEQRSSGKPVKIPKLPMVLFGKKWYRAKVLKDGGSQVLLEYQGYSHEGGPFWLAKDHSRMWRGSYKGRDWRYLGDGAWEPKPGKHNAKARSGRCRSHKSSAAAAAGNSDAAAGDSDVEEQIVQWPTDHKRPTAAAAAASEHEPSCSEQQDEGDHGSEHEQEMADAPAAAAPALAVPAAADTELVSQQQQTAEQQHTQQQQPQQPLVSRQQSQRARRNSETSGEAGSATAIIVQATELAQSSVSPPKVGRKISARADELAVVVPPSNPAVVVADSSSELEAAARPNAISKGAEAASAPAAASRARPTRGRGGARSAAGDADSVRQLSKRGCRSGKRAQPMSEAGRYTTQQQQQKADQQQQANSKDTGLHVMADENGLKPSCSNEGLPLGPTSPGVGGSPKHRRKGVPQRARLDSDDLQLPSNKGRSNSCPIACKSSAGPDLLQYSSSDAAVTLDQQALHQEQQVQQEPQMHLGWKGGWKGAYKKGIWQHQQHPEQQQQANAVVNEQEQQRQLELQQLKQEPRPEFMDMQWSVQQEIDTPKQQALQQQQQQQQPSVSAATRQQWTQQQSQPQSSQQQQLVLGGSDPQDVEAAYVLVGASMGRARTEELCDVMQSKLTRNGSLGGYGRSNSSFAAADEPQLSPRAQAGSNGRQNGKRRGHSWSKPLNRPPRPPAVQQQQQQCTGLHGKTSLQHTAFWPQAGLCNGSSSELYSSQCQALDDAAVALLCKNMQPVVEGHVNGGNGGGAGILGRNGSGLLLATAGSKKQSTLRALMDAVGELQAKSGRPDLQFPLEYGGLPLGSDHKLGALQLPHVHVSAAAAALLAAVPSLESLQQMAAVQGQTGLVASLRGKAPTLFY